MPPRSELPCIATHRSDPERPRRAADGLLMCLGCVGGMHRHLAELPDLTAQVVASMPRTRTAGGVKVGGTREPALPVNLSAGELRSQIAYDLYFWAHEVAVGRGIHLPPDGRVPTVCAWLDRHVDWLAARPQGADFREVLIELTGHAQGVIDPDRRPVDLGRCVETVEGKLCGGELWASVLDVDDPRPSSIWCDGCPLVMTAEQWYRFGRRYHVRLAAIEAAEKERMAS
jgi:hypothetical protein